MPTVADLYVSSQEPVWNVVFLYVEVKVCWILWSQARLATWAMHSGFGKHGQVTSVKSSKRTSSTMAAAGLKISTAALGLTFAVMLAANVVPTSAARLWAFESKWNEPDRSIILALHGFNW